VSRVAAWFAVSLGQPANAAEHQNGRSDENSDDGKEPQKHLPPRQMASNRSSTSNSTIRISNATIPACRRTLEQDTDPL